MSFSIGPGSRIRKSPYFDALVAHGLTHMTTYNHMFMPPDMVDLDEKCQTVQDREGCEGYAISCQ